MIRLSQMILFIACFCLALALCSCLSSPVQAYGEWPQFLGPNANGFSPEKGINKDWTKKPPAVLWKFEMSDGGYAGPSVADGKVFIVDHKEKKDIVRALDLQTGTEVWNFAYDEAIGNNYGFTRCTPVYNNGKVYTVSRVGMVHCLDAKTGAKVWVKNIITDFGGQRPQWDLSMSALVDGDKVILCPGGKDAAVVALNKDTGATIWKGGGSDMPGYATPVVGIVDGKRQYLVFTGHALIGVNPDNGQLLWSAPWETGCNVNAAAPIITGPNTIFITSGYGHGCELIEVKDNKVTTRWENKNIEAHFNSALLVGNYVYGKSDFSKGNLVCVNLANGEATWKKDGFEKGGLIGVDGVYIIMNGRGGDVALANLTPAGYQELGRITPLGGQSWTAPILADKKLIIRNTKTLACIDLK